MSNTTIDIKILYPGFEKIITIKINNENGKPSISIDGDITPLQEHPYIMESIMPIINRVLAPDEPKKWYQKLWERIQ